MTIEDTNNLSEKKMNDHPKPNNEPRPPLTNETNEVPLNQSIDPPEISTSIPDNKTTSVEAIVPAGPVSTDGAKKKYQLMPKPKILYDLPEASPPILSQYGVAFVVMKDRKNHYGLMVGSKQLNNILRMHATRKEITLKRSELNDINQDLTAYAEMSGKIHNVWSRVASIDGGIEIDMADEENTRIRVTAGNVTIIEDGSETVYYRNPVSQPMVMPANDGDLSSLNKYINLSPSDMVLFTAWLSYTLAHPKNNSSKYVHLVLQGDEGTGKSFACKTIINLLDPSRLGLQPFPSNAKDLAIAAQHAHVLCYDNLRGFKHQMADILCMASTGGTISNRALYTDADQHLYNLHAPLVLNGIHSFINQSDLAQRCLSVRTLAMPESQRKSEAQMMKELETDLPVILKGLLDLVAKVFLDLPNAEVTHPERMYDFVRWLAAMEKVRKIPAGIYQAAYSDVLHEAQLDSLMENLLSSMVIEFTSTQKKLIQTGQWSGTPAQLMSELNDLSTYRSIRSEEWPQNAIALSKRLNALKASLRTQDIDVELTRGKQRTITIRLLNYTIPKKQKVVAPPKDTVTDTEEDF